MTHPTPAEQARQWVEARNRRLREQQPEWEQAPAERQARERQAQQERSAALAAELKAAMAHMTLSQIATAIVAGTLHPAVIVNWGFVQ